MHLYTPVMWALAISLATFAGLWTVVSYQRRRWSSVLRGLALVLLPFAALFTGTLTLVMRMLDAAAVWASGFVFRPLVWVGLILAVVALVLWVAGSRLGGRDATRTSAEKAAKRGGSSGALPARPAQGGGVLDDDMAEIEEILRRRGIE